MPRGSAYESLILPPVRSAPRPTPKAPPGAPLRGGLAPGPTSRPAPVSHGPSLRAPISSRPFAGAQHEAQQHVERAQARMPVQPEPHIPRLANPTPEQTHAALTLVHEVQRRAVGPHPTTARIQQYQTELANDPRRREFRGTVEHYVRAGEGHLSALEGRRVASGNLTQSEPLRGAGKGLSQDAAVRLGAAVLAGRPQMASASALRPTSSPGLLDSAGNTIGSAASTVGDLALHALHATYGRGVGKGGIPLRAGSRLPLPPGSAAITAVEPKKLLEEGATGKGTNEVFDFPAQSILAAATLLAAAKSAIPRGQLGSPLAALGGEGNTKPLKRIGEAQLHQIEHPVQSFKQSPLSTALVFAGLEGGIGGLIGKAGRAAGVEAFSTARPDLKLYGEQPTAGPVEASGKGPAPAEGLRKLQEYKGDPLRKAAQIAYEKGLTKLPGDLRQKDPFQAEGWRLKRNLIGTHAKPGRVDYTTTGGEHARRTIVKSIAQKVAGLKPAIGQEAVPLIMDRTIRSAQTVESDLQKRAGQLRAVQPELTARELASNKTTLGHVEDLLANKAFLHDPSGAFHAATRAIAIQKPLTALRVLGGTLLPEQLRASLFPYAQTHMGAIHDGTALRAADGSNLTNEAIKAHMAEHGVSDPGFISHRPQPTAGSAYFQSVRRFPALERFNRTGEAYRKGTLDHSFQAMADHLVSEGSKVAQHEVRANDLNQYVLGSYDTPAQAQAAADNLGMTAEGKRLSALGELKVINKGANQIMERGQVAPAGIHGTLTQFGLAEHTPATTTEHGKYGIVPKEVFDRMGAHDNAVSARNDGKRFLQAYTQAFRHVKFATSPHHFAGIIQEQGIRAATEQAGVVAKLTGAKFQKAVGHLAEVDHHGLLADDFGPLGMKYRQLEGVLAGRGGLVTGTKENDIVRKAAAWQQSSSTIRGGAEMVGRSKAMKGWLAYRKATEASLAAVEHETRSALIGKALRDTGFISNYRDTLKMTDQAMRAMVENKLTPNMADMLARRVDDMGGNWNHQTPAVRAAVSTVTPFGLWWLNSLRWLYRLPVTHPIKTAIAASLYNATRASRNAEGQGYDAPGAATKTNPGYLQGSVEMTLPVFGRGRTDFGHYSPVGTLGPETGSTAVSMILPQLSGVLDALRGSSSLTHEKLLDSKGHELASEPGPSLLNALIEAASGPAVGATQLQQLLQGGGKPYGTANLVTDLLSKLGGPSQVKPHSEKPITEQLGKLIWPVRFYKNPGGGKGAGSGLKLTPLQEHQVEQAVQSSSGNAPSRGGGPTPLQELQIERALAAQH
jgi:hypothetical protein